MTLLALMLCACSQDDGLGEQALPPGEHPMAFTAAGIALSVETKATTDNDWQGVASVAVLVDGEMKPYDVTPSADYRTASLTSQDPFYWQNTNPIQVSAWWPYADGSTTMPAVVVQADQSTATNYQASDYIGATGTVQFSGSHALTFAHRTAKVVVKPLVRGNDMTDDELEGATVALAGVSTGSSDDATVTPYADAATGDRLALLPAQTIAANGPFIQVAIGSNVYSYKPEAAVELQAGYQYTYTITVNKTNLGVDDAAISGWDDTPPAIGGEALPEAPKEIDLTTGPVAINDDGRYRIVGDGTQTDNTITINGNATVQLAGVNIKYDIDEFLYSPAISITGGSPTLVIEGENTLTGVGDAGIALSNGASVTIQGLNGRDDKLTASSELPQYTVYFCPGIGNAWEEVGGNITISNVTVVATGGGDGMPGNDFGAAGIGTSSGGTVGDITITDATVVATGAFKAAGIGLGTIYNTGILTNPSMGDITISGSDITATGSYGAAAIGFPNGFDGGTFHAGKITITTDEDYNTFISKLKVERWYNGGNYMLPHRVGKGDYSTITPPGYYGKGTGTDPWPGVTLTTSDQTLTSQDGIARL